ncbi:hypothetical protein GCM10022226_53490 [Sphaerisporangium flaviroseum]|uniref:Uncharacterized protein n=1 Tax=Sphaerisporangium flaviroseum TaxID=509199 RepID=A0ABP7IT90_9ACTN
MCKQRSFVAQCLNVTKNGERNEPFYAVRSRLCEVNVSIIPDAGPEPEINDFEKRNDTFIHSIDPCIEH